MRAVILSRNKYALVEAFGNTKLAGKQGARLKRLSPLSWDNTILAEGQPTAFTPAGFSVNLD
jgi:hypothetical protein